MAVDSIGTSCATPVPGSAHPALIKLGGALLTDKSHTDSLRRAAMKRLAGEFAKADIPMVIVHGAGSFGHPHVEGTGIGTKDLGTHAAEVVANVWSHVAQLHAHVLEALTAKGMHPVSIPLHLDAWSEDGIVADWPINRIKRFLAEGFTPVIAATIIRDSEVGWRILSGDEIMSELAGELEPRLSLFLTDVDGVFEDADHETLITTLESESKVEMHEAVGDVTGGMANKVLHAQLSAQVSPTLIVNGLERGRALDALRGKEVLGTRIAT